MNYKSVFYWQFLVSYIFSVSFKFGVFVLYHFHFSFWWSIKFPQQNNNQSETGIGDKKLSVELYDNFLYSTGFAKNKELLNRTFVLNFRKFS